MLRDVQRMRKVATDFLPTVDEQTGENIRDILTNKAAVLTQIDRFARIEIAFFLAHLGLGAEVRMHEAI